MDTNQNKIKTLNSSAIELLKIRCAENYLYEFTKQSWHIIEPQNTYIDNWHIQLLCEYLQALVEDKLDTNNLLICMPPRHMKGCSKNTPILTPIGWKKHGDLNIGDKVFSPNGEQIEIIAKSEDFICDKEIVFSNGEKIKVNGDHIWRVYSRPSGKFLNKTTDELSKLKLKNGNRNNYQIQNINALIFDKKDLIIHPYFLGCWLGDGTSSVPAITHDLRDIEHIEEIHKRCGYIATTINKHNKIGSYTVRTSFVRQGLIEKIRKLNLYKNKHIPKIYLESSIEQRLQLLAGLIDTDGSCDKNGRIRIATSIETLKDDIYTLCLSLGFKPYIIKSKTVDYGIYKGGKDHWQIGFNPTIKIPCSIKRKIPKRIIKNDMIGIEEIIKAEKQEIGNCISVASDDGLYVVGEKCIATHNSICVSIMLPSWLWIKNSSKKILASASTSDLSMMHSLGCRTIIQSDWYQSRWRDKFTMADDQNAKRVFKTSKQGERRSVSVDGTVTGQGGDIIIADDLNDMNNIYSEANRKKVLHYWNIALSTRENHAGKSKKIVMQQRGHKQDVAGDIIEKEKLVPFTKLILKAEATEEENWISPLTKRLIKHREVGELLWPQKIGKEVLDMMKVKLTARGYSAQFQQSPSLEQGNIILVDRIGQLDSVPENKIQIIQTIDSAFKEGKENDFSVIQTWCSFEKDGRECFFLLNNYKERMSFPKLKSKCKELWNIYKPQKILIEDKASGQSLIQEMKTDLEMRPYIKGVMPESDKVARAYSITPTIEDLRVYIPRFAFWTGDLLEELASFPNGDNDDQVDAFVYALQHFSKSSPRNIISL